MQKGRVVGVGIAMKRCDAMLQPRTKADHVANAGSVCYSQPQRLIGCLGTSTVLLSSCCK